MFYKTFLDLVTYTDTSTKQAKNKNKLDGAIAAAANKKLQEALTPLPHDLNVNTNNVVNKATLDSYTNLINILTIFYSYY